MAKAITRHLNYAWIEYGDARDGQALATGLSQLGWTNAISGFPVEKDKLGARAIDPAHPLLPIRYKGSTLMILPNEMIDNHSSHGVPNPPVPDPIFEQFRKDNGESSFGDAIVSQNAFIANWAFCPGIQKVSDTESHLTIDGDATDYVDLLGISGHGASGTVFGGGRSADLDAALSNNLSPAMDRLKYVIIASCHNVAREQVDSWMPALRRDNPINGVLGFGDTYPGDDTGEQIFQRFVTNLKAGSGATNTVLKAWRNAHVGKTQLGYWAAVLHTSSAQNDTMADWLAGNLAIPDKDGEVRWFNEKNYPDGEVVVERVLPYAVNFFMGSTKIDRQNTNDPSVGLFPAQSGSLVIEAKSGTFMADEELTITFFYYRAAHPDMNLNTLLKFDQTPDGDFTLLTDHNTLDSTKFVDAVQINVKTESLSKVTLPFTVRPDAGSKYPLDGVRRHGFFTLQLELRSSMGKPLSFYRDGAWLRDPEP